MRLINWVAVWFLGADEADVLDAVGSSALTQPWDRFGGSF